MIPTHVIPDVCPACGRPVAPEDAVDRVHAVFHAACFGRVRGPAVEPADRLREELARGLGPQAARQLRGRLERHAPAPGGPPPADGDWVPLDGFPGYEGTASGRCRSRRRKGLAPRIRGLRQPEPVELRLARDGSGYALVDAAGKRRWVAVGAVRALVRGASALVAALALCGCTIERRTAPGYAALELRPGASRPYHRHTAACRPAPVVSTPRSAAPVYRLPSPEPGAIEALPPPETRSDGPLPELTPTVPTPGPAAIRDPAPLLRGPRVPVYEAQGFQG